MAVKVPLPEPDEGEIVHQVWELEAVQGHKAVTEKPVDPPVKGTFREAGVTVKVQEQVSCVTVMVIGLHPVGVKVNKADLELPVELAG